MTDPQTPEPTPAVERAAVAWSTAYQKAVREAPSNRLGISRTDAKKAYEMAVRAALAAALNVEEMAEVLAREDGWLSLAEADKHGRAEQGDRFRGDARAIRAAILGGAA